jgi:hypothetical protein
LLGKLENLQKKLLVVLNVMVLLETDVTDVIQGISSNHLKQESLIHVVYVTWV